MLLASALSAGSPEKSSGALTGFFIYISMCGIIVREYGEFVVGALFSNTPLIVVSGSMVLVYAIAVRGGVEIVGRFADLFLPAFFILFLLIIVPIIPDLRVAHMLPVMGEGIMPSIAGSLVLQIWFSELLTASFLLPFVSDQKKAAKSISYTLLAVILTLVVSNLATLLLLGDLTGSYTYPFLILARYINLAEFFTHLEALFMAIWVLGAFVKICVFYYVKRLQLRGSSCWSPKEWRTSPKDCFWCEVQRLHEGSRLGIAQLSPLGGNHFSGHPDGQLLADLGFQGGKMLTHRRLRHEAGLGGLGYRVVAVMETKLRYHSKSIT